MNMASMTRMKERILWLIPSVITLILYFQTHTHEYISYDDPWYTFENPSVTSGLTWEGIKWSTLSSQFSNYHPLTWWSHMLDFTIMGNAPGWFAVENALLHALNVFLLTLLFAKLFKSKTAGIIGGMIFAVHPVLIEAVAWISQRKTLISTFWALLSILLYLHMLESNNTKKRSYLQIASLLCFIVSLLAKSMYVTLPALLVLLEIMSKKKEEGISKDISVSYLKDDLLPLFKRLLPYGVLSLIFAVVAIWAQSLGGSVSTLEGYPFAYRMPNVLFGYAVYFRQFFFPGGLSLFYPIRGDINTLEYLFYGCLLLTITTLLYAFRKRLGINPLLGWLFFLISLLPVIGILHVGSQSHADRYMYGPIIGLILSTIAIGEFLHPYLTSKAVRLISVASIALWMTLLCVTSYFTIGNWRNNLTIATATLKHYPENPVASYLFSIRLMQYGHFDEARKIIQNLTQRYPDNNLLFSNLALCEFRLGNTEAALECQKKYMEHNPNPGAGLANLAKFYMGLGRYDEVREIIHNMNSHNYEINNSEKTMLLGVAKELEKLEAEN